MRNVSEQAPTLQVRDLGRIGYEEAVQHQLGLLALRREGVASDTLLLCEHEPVVTLGRATGTLDPAALLALADHGVPVREASRGGAATYHGPGQLVGYPILDLRRRGRDLHRLLRQIEEALMAAVRLLGVDAQARPGLTGVWVGPRKLASIGIAVRGWVSYHGFALNVSCDLSPFELFAPCGLRNVEMTSLARELARVGVPPPAMDHVKTVVGMAFMERFGHEHCQTTLYAVHEKARGPRIAP